MAHGGRWPGDEPRFTVPAVLRYIKIPEPDNAIAMTLSEVVDSLVAGDEASAERALRPIWGWTTDANPVAEMPELEEAKTWPKGSGARTRPISKSVKAAVYAAASYTCVYCGRLTVHPNVLRLLHRRFPEALPFAPSGHWAARLTHPAWWDISTTVDHVTAAAM